MPSNCQFNSYWYFPLQSAWAMCSFCMELSFSSAQFCQAWNSLQYVACVFTWTFWSSPVFRHHRRRHWEGRGIRYLCGVDRRSDIWYTRTLPPVTYIQHDSSAPSINTLQKYKTQPHTYSTSMSALITHDDLIVQRFIVKGCSDSKLI